MNTLVESLKRLYSKGQVSDEKLTQMVTEKKITAEEKQYITSGGSPTNDLQTYYEKTQAILPTGGANV